jgi:hypothetical protein
MRRLSLAPFCACSLLALLPAQQPLADRSPEQTEAIVAAIREWVADYEKGKLGAKGQLWRGGQLQPGYVAHARKANVLTDDDAERITHLDALQKLLFHAERSPTPAVADALLGIAATGLDASFLDHTALELRELGHWAIVRMDDPDAWFLVLRAAAGERVPVLGDLRPAEAQPAPDGVAVGPARRVAALRLIGRKNWPVFRSTLEAALTDADPRVRLAAAEAFAPPWRAEALRRIGQALARERHPVVSQALVRLLLAMLRNPPPDTAPEVRDVFVDGALAQFGRCGWRTDMDLLDVVEAFPKKEAVPLLIAALDLEARSPDALVAAVNKRASPLLRERAGALLRAMTGALIPAGDAAAWREFWQREQANITVPARLATTREHITRAQFFGVPVTGGSIAFLIDTSGSMDKPSGTAPTTGPRGRPAGGSRLDAAKEQLLLAAQAMAPDTQFRVVTFASLARSWTSSPVKAGPGAVRSLTELLSRLQPHGGTNLFDGLVHALQLDQRRFGDANAPGIDELFVLSDGEPNAGDVQQKDDLLELVRESNRYARVRIHCVFTGDAGGSGAVLLRELAEQNGGVFVQR